MKIGDKVAISKDIIGADYELRVDDEGTVVNIIQLPDETIVFFNPEDTAQVYAVNSNSVLKVKQ